MVYVGPAPSIYDLPPRGPLTLIPSTSHRHSLRQIVAFNDYVDKFREIGCEVFGISVDSKHSHLAWIQTVSACRRPGCGQLPDFPLLSAMAAQEGWRPWSPEVSSSRRCV